MVILSQDRDVLFTLGLIHIDEKYTEDGTFLGWNIYGTTNTYTKGKNDVLLGTFDTFEDTINELQEIFNAEKTGRKAYEITEAPLQPEELEELI